MIRVKRRYLMICLAALALALAVGTAFAAAQQPSGAVTRSSSPPTPIIINSTATPPGVGATQTTDAGLSITLVNVVKHGSRWLFHFQIKNIAHNDLTIRGTTNEHQFVVDYGTGAAPPNNIGYAQLGSPSASEIAANYSDLASSLHASGTTNGWLVVDTTNLGSTPTELIYREVAIPTIACTNPADQSTCQPTTLYSGITWYNI